MIENMISLNKTKDIDDFLCMLGEEYPKCIVIDGFNDSIIGIIYDGDQIHLAYSLSKMMQKLMEDMSYEDALEYFSFNIEYTFEHMKFKPIFVADLVIQGELWEKISEQ